MNFKVHFFAVFPSLHSKKGTEKCQTEVKCELQVSDTVKKEQTENSETSLLCSICKDSVLGCCTSSFAAVGHGWIPVAVGCQSAGRVEQSQACLSCTENAASTSLGCFHFAPCCIPPPSTHTHADMAETHTH